MESQLPASLKRQIAENNLRFYNIDAVKIAQEIGLGGRINTILQAAFFKIANVIPVDDAVKFIKQAIQDTYGNKGEKIVQMNYAAVDRGLSDLVQIDYPADWANAQEAAAVEVDEPDSANVVRPINALKGDDLPVSAFTQMALCPQERLSMRSGASL